MTDNRATPAAVLEARDALAALLNTWATDTNTLSEELLRTGLTTVEQIKAYSAWDNDFETEMDESPQYDNPHTIAGFEALEAASVSPGTIYVDNDSRMPWRWRKTVTGWEYKSSYYAEWVGREVTSGLAYFPFHRED